MPSLSAAPFSGATLEDLRIELRQFPELVRERGETYASTARVGRVSYGQTDFTASVRGKNGIYRAGWYREAGDWSPQCTCPVEPYCKHAYALAMVVLREAAAAGDEPRPEPRPRSRAMPSGEASDAIEQLRNSSHDWEREHALGVLLADAPVTLSAYLSPFPEILLERDPDLLCWRLAQEIAPRTEGWLPEPLEAYRDRPDLVRRLAERSRAGLERELRQWVERQHRVTPRSLRLQLRLEGSDADHGSIIAEARLTSPRMVDLPRSPQQLNQLRNDVRNHVAEMPPDQVLLLDWFLDDRGTYYARNLSTARLHTLLRLLPQSPLLTWDVGESPDLERRAGLVDGAVVRFDPGPVQLLPTLVARDGESVLELRLVWPDGTHRALDDVVYLRGGVSLSATRDPSFALCNGVIWLVTEEPPRALMDRFAEAHFLPIAEEERAATLGLLSSNFPQLRQTLAVHTRRYDAAPAIAMDLRNDDWMQLRLFAHTGGVGWSPSTSAPETVVFEYGPERIWRRVAVQTQVETPTSSPAPEAVDSEDSDSFTLMTAAADAPAGGAASNEGSQDIWIEEPDPERVAAAVRWIEDVRNSVAKSAAQDPPWADRDIGWWMLVNRKRLSALAEAWEDRPAGIGFFGTPRIRRLFTGRDTIKAKVRVVASGVDWLSVATEWEAEGRRLSDDELAELRATNSRFVKLPSGWVRREIVEAHDDASQLLADVGIDVGEGEQMVNLWQLAGARAESLEALERFGADAETIEKVRLLRERVATFEGVPPVALPEGLTAQLRPYQRHGLDFLAHCSSIGSGSLLADDMGLGKTVQALAWLLHLRATETDFGPSLVVCPASVVHNWAREAERFTPGLRVLLLTSGKERHELRKSIGEHDLVVTNYALLRRDIEDWRGIDLHAAILDEAQNIKNPDAAVTKAARELRSRHRLALTGTPLENRALDLWSILSFANPGYLGNRAQFSARYDRSDAPHRRSLLSARLRPILLRRTKAEVAPELPDRIEERIDCELTRGQRQLYLAELRRSRRLLSDLARDPDELKKNRITILAALTRLRQICCHPALAGGKPSLGSGKFDALFEQLEPLLAEGHKVLVFSQFVECLKLIAAEMRDRGLPFHMLTGQTTRRERVVAAFEQDRQASVFLISLKAGGTGLNLTSASYVVVFDPWWNPAVEAQAIDRTHRIGQTRTVIAYRLLTRGTIEEKIFDLQQRKAQLVRDVLGEEGGFARALTRADLEYLLTAEDEDDEEAADPHG